MRKFLSFYYRHHIFGEVPWIYNFFMNIIFCLLEEPCANFSTTSSSTSVEFFWRFFALELDFKGPFEKIIKIWIFLQYLKKISRSLWTFPGKHLRKTNPRRWKKLKWKRMEFFRRFAAHFLCSFMFGIHKTVLKCERKVNKFSC